MSPAASEHSSQGNRPPGVAGNMVASPLSDGSGSVYALSTPGNVTTIPVHSVTVTTTTTVLTSTRPSILSEQAADKILQRENLRNQKVKSPLGAGVTTLIRSSGIAAQSRGRGRFHDMKPSPGSGQLGPSGIHYSVLPGQGQVQEMNYPIETGSLPSTSASALLNSPPHRLTRDRQAQDAAIQEYRQQEQQMRASEEIREK